MTPFFSFIVPTHLRASLLRRSIGSIRAQTMDDFEIIVVADALDQETALVAAELLRPEDTFVKRSGTPGPAQSRNEGMRHARGEWVIFLDDDDSLMPEHLATLVHQIKHDGGSKKVYFSDLQVVMENRTESGIERLRVDAVQLKDRPVESLFVRNFIPNNVLAFRRDVLEGCEVDWHLASQEDWDFLLAVCVKAMPSYYPGGGAVVHKDVNPGTRRGTQTTSNDLTVVLDFLHIYRRWPAPNEGLREQRQALIKGVGLDLPVSWF
ncbi:glycosyltransferase [Paucibacter sp. AS339]|uniref:glycosyltransferase family 2 protein n=1 Tax=Paucibacter hankyongi TaxID=3133434 RepID=UPI0030B45CF3